MARFTPDSNPTVEEQIFSFVDKEQQVKDHLKAVLPEDVYEKWIKNFVFESISSKELIVGYYGDEPLDIFEKEYKDKVFEQICSVTGNVKKFRIYTRTDGEKKRFNSRIRKHLKVVKLFAFSLVFAAIAFVVAVIGCNYISNREFKETFYNASSLKANNKIRVIQISDLHNSTYGKDNSQLISRVEKLKPDLIILTGDCLDSGAKSTEEIVNLCSSLVKIAPSYYIYGNNEVERYYDAGLSQEELDKKFGFNDENRDPQKLIEITDDLEKELEAVGVKVLKNEMDSLEVGTTKIDVFGVLTSNPSAFWSYAGENFDEYIYTNPNNLKITAIHEPFVFEEYTPESWGDVMLAGHTHGGTIKIPMLGPVYTHEGGLFPERSGCYIYGKHDVSGQTLFVSSGMENRNLLRINNQPELVIVDINRF